MKKIIAFFVALTLAAGMLGILSVNAAAQYLSQDDFDGTIRGQSLDIIKGDGNNLYTPGATGDYLTDVKNTVYGPFQTVTMRGWIGIEDTQISEFGYAIGEGEPVFSDAFFTQTEAPVLAAGGDFALRFEITMDVSALGEEETLIVPLVKLEDGTVMAATHYNIKYTTKAAPVVEKPQTINLTADGSGSSAAFNFNGHSGVGFRFTIPEGFKLNIFTIVQSPTWNGPNQGIGLIASIYRWTNDDYDETIDSEPLDVYEEENHKDNDSLNISYNYIPAGEYLIECTEFTGNIGGWTASGGVASEYQDSFFFYVDGEENEAPVKCKMSIVPDTDPPAPTEVPTKKPTAAPTEEPTKAPTQAPTDVPTEVPATDAPKATDAAGQTDAPKATDAPDASGGPNVGLIIGIIAGVVVLAGVIVAVVMSKKKK